MSPGETVKALRLDCGMTQRELSERTGLTQSAISAIEHGDEPLGLGRAVRIAEALGVHYRDILGRAVVADKVAKPPQFPARGWRTPEHPESTGGCAYPSMPHVPNAKTRAAMREGQRGGLPRFKDIASLMADLNEGD